MMYGPWTLTPLGIVLVFVLGGAVVRRLSVVPARRGAALTATLGVVLALAVAAHAFLVHENVTDPFGLSGVDALSGLLAPFAALLGWALVLAAPRVWAGPRALGQLLVTTGLVVATFIARDARIVLWLWALTLLPTWIELSRTPEATQARRVFALYAGASALAFALGLVLLGLPWSRPADVWNVHAWSAGSTPARLVGLICILVAVSIRKATLPFHSWLVTVFEVAPPGPVLLVVAPMVGAYCFVRFAIPLFPDLLGDRVFLLGPIALVTAAYAAGLAFVQIELRRTVAWIAMSQSALVLVGLECPEGAGLTGGIVTWLSAGIAMTGLGLSAWMLEARFGRLRVDRHLGLYARAPSLALAFLLTGLSLVAFPGTVGFASDDLLMRAVLDAFPQAGLLLFVATALNGFTVLRSYMRLFHGPPASGVELGLLPRERVALVVPLVIVIWQGLAPGILVSLGHTASAQLLALARPH